MATPWRYADDLMKVMKNLLNWMQKLRLLARDMEKLARSRQAGDSTVYKGFAWAVNEREQNSESMTDPTGGSPQSRA
jgi:hypothetical protein